MYKIKYYYETGDSFSIEDREDVLEFEWNDLKTAEECLRRIREHYEWYTSKESAFFGKEKEKPKWHNVNTDLSINLPMDNGKEVEFWPPWIGYFEKLYEAEIILGGKGLKISTN
jgi:hypothetical protein